MLTSGGWPTKGNFTIAPHSSVASKGRVSFKAKQAPRSRAHVARPAAQRGVSAAGREAAGGMDDVHTGQIAALARQLARRQLPGARARPGKKGAGRGGHKGCRGRRGGCGSDADILSVGQELAAAPGYPGKGRGTNGPLSSQAPWGTRQPSHKAQFCASVKGAAPALSPLPQPCWFLFLFPGRSVPVLW